MSLTRRSFGLGASLAALGGVSGCKRALRDDKGRVRLRLWFSLGGRNREVLLEIVKRFHATQDEIHVEPVYQGDYFESLAKAAHRDRREGRARAQSTSSPRWCRTLRARARWSRSTATRG